MGSDYENTDQASAIFENCTHDDFRGRKRCVETLIDAINRLEPFLLGKVNCDLDKIYMLQQDLIKRE